MDQNNKIMHDVWNRAFAHITKENIESENIHFDELMASIFCPGPYYFYVVDFFDRQIKYMNANVERILGLDSETTKFEDIIARIHPDDIQFVSQAEEALLKYIYENIGGDKVMQYKTSYCFRLMTADGQYELFQHQAIVLSTDKNGGFAKSLNIHTNISHFTTNNNYKVTLLGLFGDNNFIQLNILPTIPTLTSSSLFSKRETEVIRLVADGLKNLEIADKLFISLYTVKNHKKNILQKASVKSSSELIAKCINEGLI